LFVLVLEFIVAVIRGAPVVEEIADPDNTAWL
jgi:hypothetical protein